MQSNLLSAWGTIGSVVLAVLVLLAMITVHEFGHYLAGKLLKFKIDEFSVGFGPALFKVRRKRSGELFAVRLIPLGGYCAFHGEDGLEEEEEEEGEAAPPPASPSPQGRGMEEANVPSPDTTCPPPTLGGGVGEGVRPEPANSVEESVPPQPASGGNFTDMPCWKRIIVLVAGAFMNYLLALLLIIIGFSAYGQSVVKVGGSMESEEFSAEYSFRAGDILLEADGSAIYLTNDIARAVNGKHTGDIVSFRVARETGEGYEEYEQKIMLRGDVSVKNSTDFSGVWRALGIDIEEREDPSSETGTSRYYRLESVYYRFGFWEMIGRSFVYSFRLAGSIFRVLGELLTGKLGLNALGGPVTTITMTSQIASQGFRDFLEISALIGVNLAVFNLLPIPALDGSKVVFTAIEWVRGKPISRKVEAIIHAVGFVLLLGFAVLVDILQFV